MQNVWYYYWVPQTIWNQIILWSNYFEVKPKSQISWGICRTFCLQLCQLISEILNLSWIITWLKHVIHFKERYIDAAIRKKWQNTFCQKYYLLHPMICVTFLVRIITSHSLCVQFRYVRSHMHIKLTNPKWVTATY